MRPLKLAAIEHNFNDKGTGGRSQWRIQMSYVTSKRGFRQAVIAGAFLVVGALTLGGSASPAKAQVANPYCYPPYYNAYYCQYYGPYYQQYPGVYGYPYYGYPPYYYGVYGGFVGGFGFGFRGGVHHGFHGDGFHGGGFHGDGFHGGGFHGGGFHGHR
jgi:hypothetical protein